jgi:hypothetical protein
VNDFTARPATELERVRRWPVFLRREDDHTGPRGDLIRSRARLRSEVSKALLEGADPHRLLVVEYRDVSDASGVFRKHSAFCIGNRIFPVHIYFDNHWSVKHQRLVSAATAAEEMAYLRSRNEVERLLRPVFDLAAIEYGRIDYNVHDGQLRVWEINTNPILMHSPEKHARERLPAGRLTSRRLALALNAIDISPSAQARVPLIWDPEAALALLQ